MKKTLTIGLLVAAFALWPLLHHGVVKHWFVSPWRLFGWAMYCVPIYKPRVELFVPRGDERQRIDFPRADPDAALAFEWFVRQRAELGTLVAPDELGRILFRHDPRLERVIVRVTQPVYHFDSDSIKSAYFEYELERLED